MRSLRGLTLLFLGLVLLPSAILGWLGFRATADFEERVQQQSAAEALRRVVELEGVARRNEEYFQKRLEEAARVAAAQLADDLPLMRPGGALELARARCMGVVARPSWFLALEVRDAGGRTILPRPPETLDHTHLQEWIAYKDARDRAARAEYRAGDPEQAASILDGVAPRFQAAALRALAWATASSVRQRYGLDVETTRTHLARFGLDTILAAGPLAVEAILRDEQIRGRLRDPRWQGFWNEVPATPRARWRWQRLTGREPGREPPEPTAQGYLIAEADLPAGASLRVSVPTPDIFAFLAEWEDGPWRNRLTLLDKKAPAGLEDAGDGFASRTFSAFGGTVRAEVRDTSLRRLASDARRRRVLTALGICALLVLMFVGVWVVRRAFAREQAARRLRDDFIANVSHELRTPLTSVRLHAEMLAGEDLDEKTRRGYARVVEAEGARLSALVDDLLDFAALERGTRTLAVEPLDLASAAREAVEALRPLADRERVTLDLDAAKEAPAMADPMAVSRILTNLLQNAWKHGRPPRDAGSSRITVAAGPGPVLEVRDNGRGLRDGEREAVFGRFHRGGGAASGTGLGLALSRHLARSMGGDLRMSDNGSETVVRLILPAVPEVTA